MKEELIEMEAMTFMRGRSIANQFIIIDEAPFLMMVDLLSFSYNG